MSGSTDIGRLGIETSVDNSGLRAGFNEAAQIVDASVREQQNALERAKKAMISQERGVRSLVDSLRQQISAAEAAASQVGRLGDAWAADTAILARMRAGLDNVDASLKGVRASANRGSILNAASADVETIQKQQALLRQLSAEAGAVGKTRTELLALRAAQLGITTEAKPFIDRLTEAEHVVTKVGHSSTAARRELLVLGHELATGNYSRLGGSLLVLGERMDILGKIMSPLGLSITGVTLAVAAMVYQVLKGQAAAERFANSLTLTGNIAGVTAGEVEGMARRITDATGATIGSTAELLASLVASGQYTREDLESTATVIQKIAILSGTTADKVGAEFGKMGDDVAAFASSHLRSFGGITAAQIVYIKKLQETEGPAAAAKFYTDALSRSLGDASQNFGYLERSLHGVERGFSTFIDYLRSIGRETTPEERVRSLTAAIEKLKQAQAAHQGGYGVDIANLQQQLDSAKASQAAIENQAEEQSKQRQRQIALNDAREYHDKLVEETLTSGQKLARAEAEYRKKVALLNSDPALKVSAEQQALDLAAIRKKYEPKGSGGLISAARLNLKPLEDSIRDEGRLLTDRDQALARAYKADQISAAAYFQQKRDALARDVAAVQAAYQKEIAIVEAAKAKARSPEQRDQLATQLVDLQDKLTQAVRDGAAKRQAITDEETAATEKYRQEVERLHDSLLALRGESAQAAVARFDNANDHLKAQATLGGDRATLADLAAARALTQQQAQLNELNQQAQLIEQQLATTEGRINLDRQVGVTTELDGMRQLQAAREQAAAQLTGIYAQEQRIAEAANDPRITQGVAQFKLKLDELRSSADLLGQKFESVFEGSLSNALVELETGTKGLKGAFMDLAKSIQTEFAKIAADDLAKRILGAASGGRQNGLGGLLASLGSSSDNGLASAKGPVPVTVVGGLPGAGGAGGADAVKSALGKAPAELRDVFAKMKDEFEKGLSSLSDLASNLFDKLAGAFSSSGGAAQGAGASGLFASLLQGVGLSGQLASGGPAKPGGFYEVNERGPELFTYANRTYLMAGAQGGTVTSAGRGAGGHTFVINQPITVMAPEGRISRETNNQIRTAAAHSLRVAMTRNG